MKFSGNPSLNNIAIIKNEKKINILSGNIFLKEDMIIKMKQKFLRELLLR